jgi:uncharacterized damage-inducible protein DinB
MSRFVFNAGMKDHYTTFAGYNAWANRRLYDAAAQLSTPAPRRQGAFFRPCTARHHRSPPTGSG